MPHSPRVPACLLFSLSVAVLLPATAAGQTARTPGSLERLAFRSDRLALSPSVEPLDEARPPRPEVGRAWGELRRQAGGPWRGFVDRRSQRIEHAEGAGIPWIPGHGNRLTQAEIASHLQGASEVDLPTLERLARAFLARTAPLFDVQPEHLKLNPARSGKASDYLWLVDFDVLRDGLPIEGARVVFRVNSGNLIQVGAENLPPAGRRAPLRQRGMRCIAHLLPGGGADRSDVHHLFTDRPAMPPGVPGDRLS